jgi:hypothetical protein
MNDVSIRHFAAAQHVSCRQFDDDVVMVDLQGGEYFALDAIGARMWNMLTSGQTTSEVASSLSVEFDAEPAQILRDCEILVDDLLRRGLLVVKDR